MSDLRGSISTLARGETLRRLASDSFDLAIVGGGIAGAGIARAATTLGLSVALLEMGDFAVGTSSRSTKLIHGGLRYLALGDVALVRETALERKEVHRRAPHLAEPRWMVLPSRSRLGRLKYRTAIALYERLGAVERAHRHQSWSRPDLEREEPALDASRHPFACAYREYLTEDARLVLANLRSAASLGACVLNYATVSGLVLEGGRARGVKVRTEEGREFDVKARCVVNAAGPWVEAVRRLEQPELARGWLHLSKGVHIALPAERLPIRNLFMLEVPDGRFLFAIPRGGLVYVGTTDTTFRDGPAVWPSVEAQDVEYLLGALLDYFAIDPIRPDEVVSAWAGLRPLIAEPGKSPGEISRRDEVLIGPAGVVSIAGGKLTGYRPMARAALTQVAEVLGERLRETDDASPLPGGDFDGDLAALERAVDASGSLGPAAAARLVRLYGSETEAVLAHGVDPLPGVEGAFAGEVEWAVREEGALHLEDVVYRRTRLAVYDAAAEDCLHAIAGRMAKLLHWSKDQTDREIAHVRERLARDLSFPRAPG